MIRSSVERRDRVTQFIGQKVKLMLGNPLCFTEG